MTLYILLVSIAVLLGVLVALLPDTTERGQASARQESPGTPGEARGGTEGSGSAGGTEGAEPAAGASEASPGPAEPEGAASPEAESQPEAVTELYPTGERGPEVPPGVEDSEQLWWLPDPATYGKPRGILYLILDDAGNNIGALPEFLEFPGAMAVAVLPQLAYSVEAAARTAAAGKEIMLHLPMEAEGGADPGPGALTVGMSDRDIVRTIDEDLGSVPGVIGVNNHMGSRATADARIMEVVLADLNRRGLFFVDSRTTARSVARSAAGYLQTPFAERDVFLDNDRSRHAILAAIGGALELAHTQDAVVMIGHATVPELASVLNEIYPTLMEHGYRFGRISELASTAPATEPAPSAGGVGDGGEG